MRLGRASVRWRKLTESCTRSGVEQAPSLALITTYYSYRAQQVVVYLCLDQSLRKWYVLNI